MQQTNQYKFNLIDSSDDFSAAPINENTQKTEEALEALSAHAGNTENPHGVTAEQVGAAKIAFGSYTGTGTGGTAKPCSLTFDFVPKILIFHGSGGGISTYGYSSNYPLIMVWGVTGSFSTGNGTEFRNDLTYSGSTVTWSLTGTYTAAANQLNASGYNYYYTAIG